MTSPSNESLFEGWMRKKQEIEGNFKEER